MQEHAHADSNLVQLQRCIQTALAPHRVAVMATQSVSYKYAAVQC